MEREPAIRHVGSYDGTRIAYYTMGTGPALVILHPFQINDLLLNWAIPLRRRVMRVLAARFTVVHLDLRGAGQSERHIHELTLDALCEDVTAVLDDVGVQRTSVCAVGTSAVVAAQLAAKNPGCVERMVLLGVGGSEAIQRLLDLRSINPIVGSDAIASALGDLDDADTAGLAEVIRHATSPEVFALYLRLLRESDLSALLAETSSPTLLVHGSDDVLFPVDTARRIARDLANAQLLTVPSTSPLGIWRDEFVVEQIVSFLEGRWSGAEDEAPQRPPQRDRSRPLGALTPREREVLTLVARGRTNQQISQDLFISLNTVSHHLKSILTKTGAQNRTEAAARARRSGLID